MPARMQAAPLPFGELCFIVERLILALNYCPVMGGNLIFRHVDLYTLRLPGFIPTSTSIAFLSR